MVSWKIIVVFVLIIGLVLGGFALVMANGNINNIIDDIPGIEPNGDIYDCTVKIDFDIISNDDIVSASCVDTGRDCRTGQLFSLFDPFGITKKTDILKMTGGNTVYQKDVTQTVVSGMSETYLYEDLCYLYGIDKIDMVLTNKDNQIQDTRTVEVN